MLLQTKHRGLNLLVVSVIAIVFCRIAIAGDDILPPPMARKIPKADTTLGDIRIDNYFWLRDKNDPDVIDYLEAENDYTDSIMKPTVPLQEKIYNEMLSRIKETDLSVPEKIDDYYYYYRTEKGLQYGIQCRKHVSMDSVEQILLDQNELAKGLGYFAIGGSRISPDHQLLAYAVDTSGAESYTIYVKDLRTGTLLTDQIPNSGGNIVWANDNKTLFYDVIDETQRPYRLYRHVLGDDPTRDALIYDEPDKSYFLDVSKTRSKAFILVALNSELTSEVHCLDANNPTDQLKLIQPRQHGIEYHVTHHDKRFFILTNDNAKNFKLMEVSTETPSRQNWKEVIPHRGDVKLESVDAFRDHLVIDERKDGLPQLQIRSLKDNANYYVDFPEPVYSFTIGANSEFNTDKLRFSYQSLVTPRSIYDYDMMTKQRELKKATEVLGGYDKTQYQSERVYAVAGDGVRVPISLVYKKSLLRKDGSNPLYLYGYGSYGACEDPWFSSGRLSLLDRGFVWAIAHVRGGGEMGRDWYEDGKLLKKKNTFTDFIACAEQLIKDRYTSKEKVVASGASAGGLLAGAILNMRPDLFKIVVADVPFVDVINTMLDASIPLTVTEYEEWGNPNQKEYYDYMKSYAPYENVAAKDYPNILITTSLNDPRVGYWEPAKWCAKLRAMKTDNNQLIFKINMDAGHGGSSGRYQQLKEVAFEDAFLLNVLGIDQ
jgi:oligopeptidase B